ncbi:MAG: hypothetical protein CMA21_04770 [Euryarchaeota archaeon]|nr:hypothetical protein [Euryarchaeota archaeon]|tara:strand:+ start:4145 stop:4639 length:495 start_codon:yes stop_codon:yes gene_type:complete
MDVPNVLDTAALINWPIELLEGGFVVENQRLELSRVSPDRMLSIEAANLIWKSPSRESIDEATKISGETGDLDGLSETDLSLIALVIEVRGHLHTDDYRMQNVCSSSGLNWSPVETVGISETWNWELKCRGCGRVTSGRGRTRFARESPGECEDCGSELKFRRI